MNYNKISTKDEPRIELHDLLNLTGAEISINALPAGAGVPFTHSHKQNEEIYGVIDTVVIGAKAAEHLRVCGVYDAVASERGDIALPKVDIGGKGRKV